MGCAQPFELDKLIFIISALRDLPEPVLPKTSFALDMDHPEGFRTARLRFELVFFPIPTPLLLVPNIRCPQFSVSSHDFEEQIDIRFELTGTLIGVHLE
jgi:hypothetical protein